MEQARIPFHVFDHDALKAGDFEEAFRFLGELNPEVPLLYRGWILHPTEYEQLFSELRHRNSTLVTKPADYKAALLFPEYFGAIAPHAIPAAWIDGNSPEAALTAAKMLGDPPYFIRDHAKSAKEISPRGCIVEGTNLDRAMESAIRELLDYRGENFEGGIVVRPFVRLRRLGQHPFGGDLFEEYRLFFFKGSMISQTPYDHFGGTHGDFDTYGFLGKAIPSPFFSADIAMTEDGRPVILELGDGGTSALPPLLEPARLYEKIASLV